MQQKPAPNEDNEGLPPIFKTWNQLYVVLVIYLIAIIFSFYWFTLSFK